MRILDRFDPVLGEDVARVFDLACRRRRGVAELVGEAGACVFVFAHFVEGEDLDALDIAKLRDELGESFDVFRIVGEAGDEDEADPKFVAACFESLGKLEGLVDADASDDLVGHRAEALDVEQD